jgi:hypothetical protein
VIVFKVFNEVGGVSLLTNQYNGSLSLLLAKVYSEYEWLPWKFVQCPKNYWEESKNEKKFIDWAAKELNIKELSDWHKVTAKVSRNFYENSVFYRV